MNDLSFPECKSRARECECSTVKITSNIPHNIYESHDGSGQDNQQHLHFGNQSVGDQFKEDMLTQLDKPSVNEQEPRKTQEEDKNNPGLMQLESKTADIRPKSESMKPPMGLLKRPNSQESLTSTLSSHSKPTTCSAGSPGSGSKVVRKGKNAPPRYSNANRRHRWPKKIVVPQRRFTTKDRTNHNNCCN